LYPICPIYPVRESAVGYDSNRVVALRTPLEWYPTPMALTPNPKFV
jgi:hypothetical protein